MHKSYSFLTQKNTNFLVEMCVFLRYNSTITKNTEEDMTMSEYRVIIADGNAQFRHTTAEFFRTDKEIIRVEEATDGQAALEKMRDKNILTFLSRNW